MNRMMLISTTQTPIIMYWVEFSLTWLTSRLYIIAPWYFLNNRRAWRNQKSKMYLEHPERFNAVGIKPGFSFVFAVDNHCNTTFFLNFPDNSFTS